MLDRKKVEAWTGVEPVYAILQTAAWTVWLPRPVVDSWANIHLNSEKVKGKERKKKKNMHRKRRPRAAAAPIFPEIEVFSKQNDFPPKK